MKRLCVLCASVVTIGCVTPAQLLRVAYPVADMTEQRAAVRSTGTPETLRAWMLAGIEASMAGPGVPAPLPPGYTEQAGDVDGDGDVDLVDVARMQR